MTHTARAGHGTGPSGAGIWTSCQAPPVTSTPRPGTDPPSTERGSRTPSSSPSLTVPGERSRPHRDFLSAGAGPRYAPARLIGRPACHDEPGAVPQHGEVGDDGIGERTVGTEQLEIVDEQERRALRRHQGGGDREDLIPRRLEIQQADDACRAGEVLQTATSRCDHADGPAAAQRRPRHRHERGAAPRATRPDDEQTRPVLLGVEPEEPERVPADPRRHGRAPQSRTLEVQRRAEADPRRQDVHPERDLVLARSGPFPISRPATGGRCADGLEGGDLRGACRIGIQEPDLDLLGVGSTEGATIGDTLGHLPGGQADSDVVTRVVHPEHQAVLGQGGDAARQQAAVTRDDDPDSHARALLQDLGPQVHQSATVMLLEGLEESLPPVEQDEEVRQACSGLGAGPLLADIGEGVLGEKQLTPGDLRAQAPREPVEPIGLVPGDHGSRVRKRHEREQGVVAAVDPVDVDVPGRGSRSATAAAERAQHRRAPGPRPHRRPRGSRRAPGRSVATSRRCSAGRSTSAVRQDQASGRPGRARPASGHRGRRRRPQRRQPRAGAAARTPASCARPWMAATSVARSVRTSVSSSIPPGAPGRPADPAMDQPAARGGPASPCVRRRRATADPRGLEGDQARVAEPGVAPAGPVACGISAASASSITSWQSLRVGDPQRDPQVGVGLDLGADDTGRALGREEQVHAERAASPSDVDQSADEVRQLGDERGELVDHDQQPRHRRRRRARGRRGSPRCPWHPSAAS